MNSDKGIARHISPRPPARAFGWAALLCAGLTLAGANASAQGAAAGAKAIPNLSGLWERAGGSKFEKPPSGAGPIQDDPKHPHNGHREFDDGRPDIGSTAWVGDITNPILQPWTRAIVKKNGVNSLAGRPSLDAQQTCRPQGVPDVFTSGGYPMQFLQTPKEVAIIYSSDHQVRVIRMNQEHSAHPVPSWYGESVGHYEGDTLVIDTIGFNDKTVLDQYSTPHTDAMHIVERYRLIDGGKILQILFTVDDPKAFTMPWSAIARYEHGERTFDEIVCPENDFDITTGKPYPIPTAHYKPPL